MRFQKIPKSNTQRYMKKILWIAGLLLIGLTGCTKADNTQYYTDIYWFKTPTLTIGIDTSLHEMVTYPMLVYRLGGITYDTDTVAFKVLTAQTTALDPENYEILTPVVRFSNPDTLRSQITLKINPTTLKTPQTIALKLLYQHPSSSEKNRRHDSIILTLNPIYTPAPKPEPEPEPEPETPEPPITE